MQFEWLNTVVISRCQGNSTKWWQQKRVWLTEVPTSKKNRIKKCVIVDGLASLILVLYDVHHIYSTKYRHEINLRHTIEFETENSDPITVRVVATWKSKLSLITFLVLLKSKHFD